MTALYILAALGVVYCVIFLYPLNTVGWRFVNVIFSIDCTLQANQEVAMVLPFLWLDDQWGTVGVPGIRSGSLRSAYVNAGKSIINAGGKPLSETKSD